MTPIKHLIIFDIDGTLTDSVTPHQSAFVAALRQMGVQEIDTNFKHYRHHTDMHIARVIYEKDREQHFGTEHQNIFEALLLDKITQEPFTEIPGTLAMLHVLEAQSRLGISYATGSLRRPALHKLARIPVRHHDLQLAASNGIEAREQVVLKAIEQARVFYRQDHFDRIIAVGDGLWDLVTARNLGLEFIGVGPHKALLLEQGAALHLDNWLDFKPEWLAQQLSLS